MADEQQRHTGEGRRDSGTDTAEILHNRAIRIKQLQDLLASTPEDDGATRHQLARQIRDHQAFNAQLEALEDENDALKLQCVSLEALLRVERRRVFFSRAAMLLCIVSVIVGAFAAVMGGGDATCIVVPDRMVNWVDEK